jgi:hypothetical protein
MEKRKEKLRLRYSMKRQKRWQTSEKGKICERSANARRKKRLKTMRTRFKNCGKTVFIMSTIKEFSQMYHSPRSGTQQMKTLLINSKTEMSPY